MSNLSIDSSRTALYSAALSTFVAGGIQGVTGIQSAQGPQTGIPAADSDGNGIQGIGPAASTQISRRGQLLRRLQQLQAQDPAKFKQVLTDAADKLNAAAQSASGSDKQFLGDLADKFTKAAGGDLSALQPPTQSPASGAEAAYQQAAQTTLNGQTLDPLSQAAASADAAKAGPNGAPQPAGAGPTGAHHHHHGGHHGGSASTQQTLQSVFSELTAAIGGSPGDGGASPASAALQPTA